MPPRRGSTLPQLWDTPRLRHMPSARGFRSTASPTPHLVQTSTGPIAYDIRGEGQPVVFLASGAHDHHDYDELRDLLPPRFQSIALDWPAHGGSPQDTRGRRRRASLTSLRSSSLR